MSQTTLHKRITPNNFCECVIYEFWHSTEPNLGRMFCALSVRWMVRLMSSDICSSQGYNRNLIAWWLCNQAVFVRALTLDENLASTSQHRVRLILIMIISFISESTQWLSGQSVSLKNERSDRSTWHTTSTLQALPSSFCHSQGNVAHICIMSWEAKHPAPGLERLRQQHIFMIWQLQLLVLRCKFTMPVYCPGFLSWLHIPGHCALIYYRKQFTYTLVKNAQLHEA